MGHELRLGDQKMQMHAEGCTFKENGGHGVHAMASGAQAVLKGCCSSGNKLDGFHGAIEANMTVRESSSDCNRQGFAVLLLPRVCAGSIRGETCPGQLGCNITQELG